MCICQLPFVYRILGMVSPSPPPLSIYPPPCFTLLTHAFPHAPPDSRETSLKHIPDRVTPSCFKNHQFPPFSATGFLSLGLLDIEGRLTLVGAFLSVAECSAASLVSNH